VIRSSTAFAWLAPLSAQSNENADPPFSSKQSTADVATNAAKCSAQACGNFRIRVAAGIHKTRFRGISFSVAGTRVAVLID